MSPLEIWATIVRRLPVSSASSSESPSVSPSSSASPSLSPSASVSPSPSAGYAIYSRGDYLSLPTNSNDLEIAYSEQDYIDVASKDDIRVDQSAPTGQYAIHEFKDYAGDETACLMECELQSTIAPSEQTIYLQIFNVNSGLWETVDSNNTASADTDFSLIANILDLTNYKDVSKVMTCRVYQ